MPPPPVSDGGFAASDDQFGRYWYYEELVNSTSRGKQGLPEVPVKALQARSTIIAATLCVRLM